MIVLGLILVVVAIAAAVLLVLGAQPITATSTLETGIFKFELTPLALLIAGAAIMLLLWFGLGMMRGSMKRKRRPGREAKEAQRQAELEESIRADERQRAEETHQSALADRDRAKDAELESRLAERDRTRDEEFRTREREIEDRARADERARLERELSARQATAAAAVPAAGAAGAGTAAAVDSSRSDETGRARDGSEDERLHTPTSGPDGVTDAGGNDGSLRDDDDAHDDSADRPAHRTMADRIMGRDPEARS